MSSQDKQTMTDDALLIDKVRAGSHKAYVALYDNYHYMVYSLALFYLKDTDQAQDVVQHIFLKLWEQRFSFELHSSFRNYLFTATRNHIINTIRANQLAFEKNYELAQEAPLTEELDCELHQKERIEVLKQAVDSLPPAQRRVVTLRLTEELGHHEVALRMNISINTVKSHYQAALKTLRRLLTSRIEYVIMLIWTVKL